jgi:hypothetical protein
MSVARRTPEARDGRRLFVVALLCLAGDVLLYSLAECEVSHAPGHVNAKVFNVAKREHGTGKRLGSLDAEEIRVAHVFEIEDGASIRLAPG